MCAESFTAKRTLHKISAGGADVAYLNNLDHSEPYHCTYAATCFSPLALVEINLFMVGGYHGGLNYQIKKCALKTICYK